MRFAGHLTSTLGHQIAIPYCGSQQTFFSVPLEPSCPCIGGSAEAPPCRGWAVSMPFRVHLSSRGQRTHRPCRQLSSLHQCPVCLAENQVGSPSWKGLLGDVADSSDINLGHLNVVSDPLCTSTVFELHCSLRGNLPASPPPFCRLLAFVICSLVTMICVLVHKNCYRPFERGTVEARRPPGDQNWKRDMVV